MLDGCLDWQDGGLIRPRAVVSATDEYCAAQDTFGQWLDEACDVEPGNQFKIAASAALFDSWKDFAIGAGANPGSSNRFSDSLQKRGIERQRGRAGTMFKGIRLKSEPTLAVAA
jgi:putative DNA primase/helicase